jgi:putative ABC transport system permease protein
MLLHSKLRSWLTVIGIVIGVSAVVAIISIGQGLQQNVQSQIGGLGQDIITINLGSGRAFGGGSNTATSTTSSQRLSDKDLQTLKLVSGLKYITGVISGRSDVVYNSETASLSVQGLDPGTFKEFVGTTLAGGRYFSQGETGSVIIGNRVSTNIFKSTIKVGYTLKINGHPYKVIGILASSSGFGSTDNVIYTSTKDAREILQKTLDLAPNEYSSLQVKVNDATFIENTTAKIDAALINSRHVRSDKKDFSVTSPLALQQRFSSLTSSITLFLGLIAAVSLIVGGIGVANTMFTSVLEKTKDIGIMKAIGAKNKDILLIFLLNSGMLGLVGGLLGVISGSLISYLLPLLGSAIQFPGNRGGLLTSISPTLLILSLTFSVVIGMVSGAIPAYRASKLKPVDALRYE